MGNHARKRAAAARHNAAYEARLKRAKTSVALNELKNIGAMAKPQKLTKWQKVKRFFGDIGDLLFSLNRGDIRRIEWRYFKHRYLGRA